jgi:capsule polysaccharide export protein KpsC/LpsZ
MNRNASYVSIKTFKNVSIQKKKISKHLKMFRYRKKKRNVKKHFVKNKKNKIKFLKRFDKNN